ncbi:hypothetical protein [Paenibacillus turpanensis]|uniref:hypothetical protein n=1 Tax=Paenibacillus turpanensis TaxID=2689078 RepID=UPI001409B787|nr:hypothetical protein [Paenibacillus turpanensis]
MKKLVKKTILSVTALGAILSLSAFSAFAADTPHVGNYSFYLGKGYYSVTRPGVEKVKTTSSAINNNEEITGYNYSLRSRILNNDEDAAVTSWVSFDEGNRISMSYTSKVSSGSYYKMQIGPNAKETSSNIYAKGTWSPDDKNDF